MRFCSHYVDCYRYVLRIPRKNLNVRNVQQCWDIVDGVILYSPDDFELARPRPQKSCILSRGPLLTGIVARLTIEHMFLERAMLQQSRDEWYTADSLGTLFETIPGDYIVDFVREAEFCSLM